MFDRAYLAIKIFLKNMDILFPAVNTYRRISYIRVDR